MATATMEVAMRTIAVLAAIIVGAVLGAVVGLLLDLVTGIGGIGVIGMLVGAVALPILVARLVPRSGRGQRRHDQANQRMGDYRQQYPNRVIRRDQ